MTMTQLYAMYGETQIQAEMLNQRIQTLRAQILEQLQQQRLIEAQKLEEESKKIPPVEAPEDPAD